MKAYSFLDQSTGILGHNSANFEGWYESNRECFGGQLFELTRRGGDFLWIEDDLSKPIISKYKE